MAGTVAVVRKESRARRILAASDPDGSSGQRVFSLEILGLGGQASYFSLFRARLSGKAALNSSQPLTPCSASCG